jgi:hypothetical protein
VGVAVHVDLNWVTHFSLRQGHLERSAHPFEKKSILRKGGVASATLSH